MLKRIKEATTTAEEIFGLYDELDTAPQDEGENLVELEDNIKEEK